MRLQTLPGRFTQTRAGLHQIAFFALGPARHQGEGRMGLQPSPGGFGTPRFDGFVARVEGDSILVEESDTVSREKITTVRAACEFLGIEYQVDWFADFHDPLAPVDPDEELDVDDTASRALGQWFDFGFDVLNRLGDHGVEGDDVSQVQLWPEHFDPATELGSAEKGQRASYGVSPGDSGHRDPYLYVAPWGEVDGSNGYWNSSSFTGSLLGYPDLVSADDPSQVALDFLIEGHRILHSA